MRADTSSAGLVRPFETKDGRGGVVRPARRSDAAACIAIVRQATLMRPRTIMTTTDELWDARTWRRRMLGLGDAGITLVAEVAGVVAGLCGVSRGERAAVRHAAEVGITVGERYRGAGVGRALMEAAEAWARGCGVERIELGVYESNAPARALYASLGYEVEGVDRRSVKFPEGYLDKVRMAKFLSPSQR